MAKIPAKKTSDDSFPSNNEFLRGVWQKAADVARKHESNGHPVYVELVRLASCAIEGLDAHLPIRTRLLALMQANALEVACINNYFAKVIVDAGATESYSQDLDHVRSALRLAESVTMARVADYCGENK